MNRSASSAIWRTGFLHLVFAIVFPAFTGMTAGVGLSGDLANPRRPSPWGSSRPRRRDGGLRGGGGQAGRLGAPRGPGLGPAHHVPASRSGDPSFPSASAAATLSSAIGSILVAPRTLQALGGDGILPFAGKPCLGRGGRSNQRAAERHPGDRGHRPGHRGLGDVDLVARIVSMFFMVTYGALCAISFLEHFAARPSTGRASGPSGI